LKRDVGGLKTVEPGAVGQNLGIYIVILLEIRSNRKLNKHTLVENVFVGLESGLLLLSINDVYVPGPMINDK
jgi:hypothetical protein